MEGIYHDADLKDSPVSEKKTVVDSPNIAQTSDFSNLPINLQLDSEEKNPSLFTNGSHTPV